MKKPYKAAIMDLRFNKARSLVVILSLVLVIGFPIALLNVTWNLNNIIEEEEERYQLAHYNFFFADAVDVSVAGKITQWAADFLNVQSERVIVEGRIMIDATIQSQGMGELSSGDWLDIDFISIDPNNLPKINQLVLNKGDFPQNGNEIAVLSSLAKADGLDIGDPITMFGPNGPTTFSIVGLVEGIEFASYELSQTGAIYANFDGMSRFFGEEINGTRLNSYPIYLKDNFSLDKLRELYYYLDTQIKNDSTIEEPLVFVWFSRETSFRKGMQDALDITDQYLLVASLFIFLVAGVIIFVTMNRYIHEQKTTIGAMYSYGVRKREIVYSFFLRIFLLSLISVVIGLLLAKWILDFLVSQLVEKWGLISTSSDIQPQSVIFTLFGATVISYGFTFLALINLIRLTPYEAMRGKSSELKSRGFLFALSNLLPTRVLRFSAKNLTRNRTRTMLTVLAFTLSLSFSGSLIFTDHSITSTIDTYYEDQIYYDLEIDIGFENANNVNVLNSILALDTNNDGLSDIKKIEPYILTFVPFTDEPEKLTFLKGLQKNTSMFDLSASSISEGRWFEAGTNEAVVSRYVAGSLGVNIGETVSFLLLGKNVNVSVVGITNELMISSSIISDLGFLTQLYRANYPANPDNYVFANRFLVQLEDSIDTKIAQDSLNKQNENISISLSKNFYKRRMDAISNSQTVIIDLLIVLGLIVGVVAVFTTILISIAERERELGLLNVLGYKKREIRSQLLIEGLLIGIFSIIPGILLSISLSEQLWIKIISDSFFEVDPSYTMQNFILLIGFTIASIAISVIISYLMTTRRGMVEAIREE